jgi:flagellar protein FliS
MRSASYASSAYAAVQIETDVAGASPHRLVQLLFEAALAAVHRATERMRARDVATKGTAISKAIQIIEEGLIASLDLSAGGELAERLRELYRYMTKRLLLASVQNDPAGLEEVARLLAELRDAWATIGAAAGGAHRDG